jgi:hypothetical protein
MAQGISSNAAELKQTYGDEELDYAQSRKAPFLEFIGGARSMATDIGSAFYWEVPLNSGWNVGVTSDGGVFPTDSVNVSINPYVNLGQLVGKFSNTLLLEEVAQGRGSYVPSAAERGRKDILNDVMSLADRYLAGGSGDGALATVAANTSTSTSFVADLPLGTILLEKGMRIQIHDGTSTEREDYTTISKIVPATRTVTVADSQNLTAADKVYISLGASGGTFGLTTHINGLGNLVSDTGTVHNINRATYEDWKCGVYGYGGVNRDYDDGLVHNALARQEMLSKADSVVDVLASNSGVIYQFNKSLRADRQIARPDGNLSSADTGVNLGPVFHYGDRAIPFKSFKHIKPRSLYGLVKKHFRRFGKARPKIMDGFELGISSNSRTTTKEVFLVWHLQVATARMNEMFRIDDISDPVLCGADVNGTDV